LFLAKTITASTLVADKIQRLTLKSAFNCTKQGKNPMHHSQQDLSNPGKKPLGCFSFLFSFSQQTENRSSIRSNSVTFWTPRPWEVFLHHAALKKKVKPFLPTSQLQCCLFETAE
jgi:hypothetical protein